MFYHNPSSCIEGLLRTTSWLKPIETITSSNGEEFPFGKVADIFDAAIVGMNGTKNTVVHHQQRWFWSNHVKIPFLKLRACPQSPFLGDGFPNFIMDLLRRTYPTLRGRLFRRSRRSQPSFSSFMVSPGETLEMYMGLPSW